MPALPLARGEPSPGTRQEVFPGCCLQKKCCPFSPPERRAAYLPLNDRTGCQPQVRSAKFRHCRHSPNTVAQVLSLMSPCRDCSVWRATSADCLLKILPPIAERHPTTIEPIHLGSLPGRQPGELCAEFCCCQRPSAKYERPSLYPPFFVYLR